MKHLHLKIIPNMYKIVSRLASCWTTITTTMTATLLHLLLPHHFILLLVVQCHLHPSNHPHLLYPHLYQLQKQPILQLLFLLPQLPTPTPQIILQSHNQPIKMSSQEEAMEPIDMEETKSI